MTELGRPGLPRSSAWLCGRSLLASGALALHEQDPIGRQRFLVALRRHLAGSPADLEAVCQMRGMRCQARSRRRDLLGGLFEGTLLPELRFAVVPLAARICAGRATPPPPAPQ